jgi:hypothetical protein
MIITLEKSKNSEKKKKQHNVARERDIVQGQVNWGI